MRTIKNLDAGRRGLIYNAVSSNGGKGVSISSLQLMEDIYTKLSIDIDLENSTVKIEPKDCIADVILIEDEYSLIQRCLKSETTPWENYPQAKMAITLSEELGKVEFKEDPVKEKEK
jgi:hypothetical protein